MNAIAEYRRLFARAFNRDGLRQGGDITIHMRREVLAEFQMSLPGANAPLDRYARGSRPALTDAKKRGALLFFGKAKCVQCHRVDGQSNEMFSDFQLHRIGGPQIFPIFGVDTGNVIYDGPGEDEDFGAAQTTGDAAQRYMFRTAPLRNLAVSPRFFHNGAFATLDAAIAHHLDALNSGRLYDRWANGLAADLLVGPIKPVIDAGLDPMLQNPVGLSASEFHHLVTFVRDALLDERVLNFCKLIPSHVPSG